jgi:hypothetical protein
MPGCAVWGLCWVLVLLVVMPRGAGFNLVDRFVGPPSTGLTVM